MAFDLHMTWPRWQRLAHDPEPLVARFQRTLVANRQACQPVKHVLFLDDNATLRELIAHAVLPKYNVVFHACGTIAEARAILETQPIDAALLDIRVGDGDGISLYREIADKFPMMDVSFLTAYDLPECLRAIAEIGPARVFGKDRMSDMDFLRRLFGQLGISPQPESAPPFPSVK